MKLIEEDFKLISLSKLEFEMVYTYNGFDSWGKIYFTLNESSFKLKAFRLEKQKEIFTTEELK